MASAEIGAFFSAVAASSVPPFFVNASSARLVLVEVLDVAEEGDLTLVGIEGSHFLWKMVRRIVGVLVEIGRGGLAPSDAPALLGESTTAPARLTAPPSGLFLERVYYRGEERTQALRAATPLRLSP